MTKAKQTERDQAIAELRGIIKPGDTVRTILRHASASGMSRIIDLVIVEAGDVRSISWLAARAMGDKMVNDKHYGIRVAGCGMDMGFHLVYNLSRTLFRDSFACIGADCPANDHVNAYSVNRSGQCIICRATLPEKPQYTRTNNNANHTYPVCSQACASGTWMHSDGGYALRHKWI
jgi:hypothetical protein